MAVVSARDSAFPAETYTLDGKGSWSRYDGGALREYDASDGRDGNKHYVVSILENADLTSLAGARIFVGYGSDDQEMLAAQRFREVYVVQPQ